MGSNIQIQVTNSVVNLGGGTSLSSPYLVVGGTGQTVDVTLAAGTNQPVTASWLAPGTSAGDLQLIYIQSTQSCTLLTNSTGSPTNTIAVTAGIPILWDIQEIFTCPFSGNVTSWFITNTNALRLRALILTF